MFLRKKKVDVILHSIINTVLSSISEHLILQVRLLFLKEQKWLCLVIMLQFLVELGCGIAMENQLRFAIREGGRTVGAGQVTEILE